MPPPHGSPPGIRTPSPTPPASVPGPNTVSEFKAGEFRSSFNAGSVFMNSHGKFLGALFTAAVVLTVVAGSATHLKDEVRRVKDLVKHEAELRQANEAKGAAQSEAANQKSKADVFRVLTGADHKDVVEMTKKKNIGVTFTTRSGP